MKTCINCRATKAIVDFSRDQSRRDGLDVRCKPCARARSRAYRAANYERDVERVRVWREANRAYLRAKAKEYRESYPDEIRARHRAFKKAHPDRYRAHQSKRRARARGAAAAAATAVIPALLLEPCVYCGATEHIEIDHIMPLARGGKHEPENLAPACRRCNRSKGAKLLTEWRAA